MTRRSLRKRHQLPIGVRLGGVLALLFVLAAAAIGLPRQTRADDWSPPATVFVPASGHTINGLFLDLWRTDSAFLGNPITEEIQTTTSLGKTAKTEDTVQYYDNVALVYLPDQDADWQVQTLQLGRKAAGQVDAKDRVHFTQKGSCGGMTDDVCTTFSQTGHTLRLGFKDYWNNAGGLPLLGLPLSEEFKAADGHTVQYFERTVLQWKQGEDVTPVPLGKQVAQRLKLDTKPIAQAADIPTYDEALFVPPAPQLGIGGESGGGPGPQVGAEKEIVVSLSAQELWAYEDGQLVMDSLVSTGREGFETPEGTFAINEKLESQTMEGVLGGEYYNVPDVPWVMYFTDRGHALHGTYWHNNFGNTMSHGCVNLPMDVAEWMYGWAPIGTPVTIID